MKKFRNSILARTKSRDATTMSNNPDMDSPEANAAKGVQQFCESASDNGGEEVLHLPVIVEAAESSPQAAASAAYQIRKCLSSSKTRTQYNAIMLIRILADNPGPSFTRNFDTKFVSTVKDLLKTGKDPSVQQMMRETLDSLEADKSNDAGLTDLLSMWRHVKGHNNRITPHSIHRSPPMTSPPLGQQYPQHNPRGFLPTPTELASRVEEARNTAKILLQLLQSTPTEQVITNELVKEFSDRCQTAQRSMQEYINCTNPTPDDDTLQTLIETNEQLSLALSRHQRAILTARRALGATRETPSPHLSSGFSAPAVPPPQQANFAPTPQTPYPANSTLTASPVSPIRDEFTAPAGPPPSHLNRGLPSAAPSSHNPFADPRDDAGNHDLDYLDQTHPSEPRHYGAPGGQQRPDVTPVTESYLGRQYSAANGLTMHGVGAAPAQGDVSPVESRDGRGHGRYRY